MAAKPTNPHRSDRGLLKVLAAASLMGTLGPLAAVAYDEGVGPATFSALRAGLGAAILGGMLVAHRQPSIDLRSLAANQRARLAVAVVINGLMNLALFLAFGAMAVGLVMVVYYTYPALVAVMSAALGRDRLTPTRIGAIAVASAGLVVLIGSQLDPGAHATATGLWLAFLAAAGQAGYLVVIRDGFDDVPAVQATSLVLAGGLVISGTAAIMMQGTDVIGPWVAAPAAWLAIVCAGTFGAAPKAWVIGGVRAIGSTRAAVAMTVEPVVAVVVAALALGQGLTELELVGGAAILVAVVLVQQPAPPTPATLRDGIG
jgi:drug/metabolite transporter (DMT)-like permease